METNYKVSCKKNSPLALIWKPNSSKPNENDFFLVLINSHLKYVKAPVSVHVCCHHTPCPGLRTDFLLVLCLCLDLQILRNITHKSSQQHPLKCWVHWQVFYCACAHLGHLWASDLDPNLCPLVSPLRHSPLDVLDVHKDTCTRKKEREKRNHISNSIM